MVVRSPVSEQNSSKLIPWRSIRLPSVFHIFSFFSRMAPGIYPKLKAEMFLMGSQLRVVIF